MGRRNSGSGTSQTFPAKIALVMGSILFLFTLVIGYCLYLIIDLSREDTAVSGRTDQIAGTVRQLKSQFDTAAAFREHPAGAGVAEAGIAESMDMFQADLNRAGQLYRETGNRDAVRQVENLAQLAQQYREILRKDTGTAGEQPSTGSEPPEELVRAGKQFAEVTAGPEHAPASSALTKIQNSQQAYFKNPSPDSGRQLAEAVMDSEGLVDNAGSPARQEQLRNSLNRYKSALDRHQAVSLSTDDPAMAAVFAAEQQRQKEAMEQVLRTLQQLTSQSGSAGTALQAGEIIKNIETYLDTGDEKYALLVNQGFDELSAMLPAAAMDDSRKEKITVAAGKYREEFNRFVGSRSNDAGRDKNADKLLAGLKNGIYALPAANPAPARNDLAGIAGRPEIILPAGAGLAVLMLGIVSIFLLGRAVSVPIRRITDQVRQIRNGRERMITLPGRKKTEFGLLAAEVNDLLMQREKDSLPPQQEEWQKDPDAAKEIAELQARLVEIEQKPDSVWDDRQTDLTALDTSLEKLQDIIAALNQAASSLTEQRKGEGEAIENCSTSFEAGIKCMQDLAGAADEIAGIIDTNIEHAEQTGVAALNAAIKAAKTPGIGPDLTKMVKKLDGLARNSKQASEDMTSFSTRAAQLAVDGASAGNASRQALQDLTETSARTGETLEEISRFLDELAEQTAGSRQTIRQLLESDSPWQESKEEFSISDESDTPDSAAPQQPDESEEPQNDSGRDLDAAIKAGIDADSKAAIKEGPVFRHEGMQGPPEKSDEKKTKVFGREMPFMRNIPAKKKRRGNNNWFSRLFRKAK